MVSIWKRKGEKEIEKERGEWDFQENSKGVWNVYKWKGEYLFFTYIDRKTSPQIDNSLDCVLSINDQLNIFEHKANS